MRAAAQACALSGKVRLRSYIFFTLSPPPPLILLSLLCRSRSLLFRLGNDCYLPSLNLPRRYLQITDKCPSQSVTFTETVYSSPQTPTRHTARDGRRHLRRAAVRRAHQSVWRLIVAALLPLLGHHLALGLRRRCDRCPYLLARAHAVWDGARLSAHDQRCSHDASDSICTCVSSTW